MITLMYVLMILSCFIIIVAVLLQPSKGGGLSALGGSNQSVFGSTGGNSFLFNVTMWCAAFIMVASLVISRYQVVKNKSSVFDEVPVGALPPPANTTPKTTTPAAPIDATKSAAPVEAAKPETSKAAEAARKVPSTPTAPATPGQ